MISIAELDKTTDDFCNSKDETTNYSEMIDALKSMHGECSSGGAIRVPMILDEDENYIYILEGSMEGQKVICNNCKGIRHITTKFYDPNQTPRGNFLELIDPWKKWRWNCYDNNCENLSGVPASLMCCPGCAAPMVKNGRLTIAPEPVKQKTQSEINQEKIKSLDDFDDVVAQEMLKKSSDILTNLIDEFEAPVFKCKICGKEFKVQIALTGHMRSHSKK